MASAAQDMQTLRDACREDYKKLCASVKPGGGRAKQCLTDNLDKLAPACKAAVSSKLLKPKS